jgi:hypothetical protein
MVLGDPASAAMLTANIREREHLKGLKWDPDNADMWFAFRGELAVRPDFGCVEFEGAIAVPDKPGVFVADSSSSIFLKAPEVKP